MPTDQSYPANLSKQQAANLIIKKLQDGGLPLGKIWKANWNTPEWQEIYNLLKSDFDRSRTSDERRDEITNKAISLLRRKFDKKKQTELRELQKQENTLASKKNSEVDSGKPTISEIMQSRELQKIAESDEAQRLLLEDGDITRKDFFDKYPDWKKPEEGKECEKKPKGSSQAEFYRFK